MPARETVDERDDHQGGTYRLELVSCGKDRCTRCAGGPAHGPYWYRYYRRGGKVVSKYVGKTLPAGAAAGLARRGDAGEDTARTLPDPSGPPGAAGPARDQEIADALIRGVLDAAKPEHRAGVLASMPAQMRADVGAAVARAEEAERARAAAAALDAVQTGGEAAAAVAGLGKADLLALAGQMNISVRGRDSAAAIRRAIVRRVQSRLDSEAILGTSLRSPLLTASTADRVIAAYRALTTGPGDFVQLAELRRELAGVPRAELDATLGEMYRAHQVNVVSQANQEALTDADRAAALEIGGSRKHRISIEH